MTGLIPGSVQRCSTCWGHGTSERPSSLWQSRYAHIPSLRGAWWLKATRSACTATVTSTCAALGPSRSSLPCDAASGTSRMSWGVRCGGVGRLTGSRAHRSSRPAESHAWTPSSGRPRRTTGATSPSINRSPVLRRTSGPGLCCFCTTVRLTRSNLLGRLLPRSPNCWSDCSTSCMRGSSGRSLSPLSSRQGRRSASRGSGDGCTAEARRAPPGAVGELSRATGGHR